MKTVSGAASEVERLSVQNASFQAKITLRRSVEAMPGTAMLAAHHALMDEKGTPAYLEAASPRTRDIYLRVGYNDLGPPIEFPDGPAMYPMWRPPAPGPAPGPAPAPDPTTRVRGPSAVSR